MPPTASTTEAPRRAPRWLAADSLADSVAILLVLTVLQRAVGFGRGIFFCRWLDPQELGQWDMAYSFLLLAAPVAVLSLPGSFGRYLAHYRQRGQMRTFFSRMAFASAALAGLAVALMWLEAPWFSRLIFGRDDRTELVGWLAACLAATIASNFVAEAFTALRWQRVASGLLALNTLVFTGLGLAFLAGWRLSATSLVAAFALGGLVTFAVGALGLGRAWRQEPAAGAPQPLGAFWARLLPFSISVWLTNWLTNLFALVDRWMLVHYSGLSSDEALAQVGQYHSSRLAPLLFVMLANLLASLVMPHLSHDWETGRRGEVAARLNFTLKALGLMLLAGSVLVLWVAPFMFGVVFQGKFAAGMEVLPWTLTYCSWASLACIARCYLWCAEKAWQGSLAYLAGIAVNIGLNMVLLPTFGLHGAVWATAAGNVVALAFVAFLNRRHGMPLDSGVLLVSVAPLSLGLGPWAALATFVAMGALALHGDLLFRRDEKRRFVELARQYRDRLKAFGQRCRTAPAMVE